MFKKAVKTQSKLRLALIGVSGSGKTYTALAIASGLGQKIAVIDTEHGSASKYADLFEFDVCELSSFHPQQYINAIQEASAAGYDVVIIDSLSHAWTGKDGALELVDKAAAKSRGDNRFTAWKDVTPLHNQLVEAILRASCHVIVTMRAKADYVIEEYVDGNGRTKTKPVKVGLAPIQRDGLEYEFDVVADMTIENQMVISKSRCVQISGEVFHKPGAEVASILGAWLSGGAIVMEPKLNRDEVMATVKRLRSELGWSAGKAKAAIAERYRKDGTAELSDGELKDLADFMQSTLERIKEDADVAAEIEAEAATVDAA